MLFYQAVYDPAQVHLSPPHNTNHLGTPAHFKYAPTRGLWALGFGPEDSFAWMWPFLLGWLCFCIQMSGEPLTPGASLLPHCSCFTFFRLLIPASRGDTQLPLVHLLCPPVGRELFEGLNPSPLFTVVVLGGVVTRNTRHPVTLVFQVHSEYLFHMKVIARGMLILKTNYCSPVFLFAKYGSPSLRTYSIAGTSGGFDALQTFVKKEGMVGELNSGHKNKTCREFLVSFSLGISRAMSMLDLWQVLSGSGLSKWEGVGYVTFFPSIACC